MKLFGIINVDFHVTDQLLARFSAFFWYWRKNGSTMRQYISYSETSNYIETININREILTDVSKESGLEMNAEKTKYILLPYYQNEGQNWT
jgi:hypothetical protein